MARKRRPPHRVFASSIMEASASDERASAAPQVLHQPQRIHVHNQIPARNLGGIGLRQHPA